MTGRVEGVDELLSSDESHRLYMKTAYFLPGSLEITLAASALFFLFSFFSFFFVSA